MEDVKIMTDKTFSDKEKEVLVQFKQFLQAMIDKDEEKLNELLSDEYILIHMSGKRESKEEFINDLKNNTLNYYESTLNHPKIIIEENAANLISDITLDAKVYGMKGVWTLNSTVYLVKKDKQWIIVKWDN